MLRPKLQLLGGDWSTLSDDAMRVRHAVFVVEQNVPPELELDAWDPHSHHVVARIENLPIGTGRLLPDGHIGRLAVVAPWRKQQVGTALMHALLARAQVEGMHEVMLHAQIQAEAFYRRLGFEAEGEVFMEAGLPHQLMRHRLG